MDTNNECPVCYDEFTEPVSLSCGHPVCWPCFNLTRQSDSDFKHLCPLQLCTYNCITPLYLSTSKTMTSEQLEQFGPRPRSLLNLVSGSRPSSEDPSTQPRRSSRRGRGTHRNRYNDFVDLPVTLSQISGESQVISLDSDTNQGSDDDFLPDVPHVSLRRDDESSNESTVDAGMNSNQGQETQVSLRRNMENLDGSSLEARMNSNQAQENNQSITPLFNNARGGRANRINSGSTSTSSSAPSTDMSRAPAAPARSYLKTYERISGTNMTHESAILEAVYEYMQHHQVRIDDVIFMSVARCIKDRYPYSFPGFEMKEIGKRVGRSLESSLKKYREKQRNVGRSGRSGPPNTADEDLCSQIISLEDSLRLNQVGQSSSSQVPGRETLQQPSNNQAPMSATQPRGVQHQPGQSTSIAVDRRRGPSNGREARESSLTPVRHQRQSRQRMETTFVEALENSVSLRNSNSEDKQNLKERRFQEEIRQRDLDRDERRHDRELTKQTNLLVAGCVSSMFNGRNTVGNLFDFQRVEEKEMLIQYCPGEGIRRPLPLSIRIKSIAELVRELKEYSGINDVSSIAVEREGQLVMISARSSLDLFHSSVMKFKVEEIEGYRYFKMHS